MNLTRLKLTRNPSNLDLSEEMARKKLIERIAISLKLKYNNLFTQNSYSIKNLISDLKTIITIEDVTNTSYEMLYTRIEQIILTKFARETKKKSKSSDLANTINIIPKGDKSSDSILSPLRI